ncbi:MAG TPA: NAD-dependent epimerase/dehydratase family protein [Acidimicrobiales bacterium]|nr:NAD-dependent epimerase/dehydratase family protein [Acidimicrobiales bacterium]
MSSVFILGGTGQVGRATAERFRNAGWDVTVASRGKAPGGAVEDVRAVEVDRSVDGALEEALGDRPYDALVDVIPYTDDHAAQLVRLAAGSIGTLIAVSTISVYVDSEGRGFETATGPETMPALPVPIRVACPTVEPDPGTYSSAKVAVERRLLSDSAVPVTILRAGAIYGRGSPSPREWWVVKRVLDGRPVLPLANRGRGVFHHSAAANIASMALAAAERPATRIVNAADPDPLPVGAMVLALLACLARLGIGGADAGLLLLDADPFSAPCGRTPWSVSRDVMADIDEAIAELGPLELLHYEEAVQDTVEWLVTIPTDGWEPHLPGLKVYGDTLFDYAAEDAYLRRLLR